MNLRDVFTFILFYSMSQYDVVIIGSGLGGLLSAVILAKEGMSVAVIEQNKQVGGCLQTFSFEKKVFDSCVHYIGSMDEGQTQRKIFDYAGIGAGLGIKRLDVDGFDRIVFHDDPVEYPHAQGLGHFAEVLASYFDGAGNALSDYVKTLRLVGDSFPLYNLRNGTGLEKDKVSHWTMQEILNRIPQEKLRQVLMGNSLLYAGSVSTTPFYIHALVTKSYINSAYKVSGGSAQISKLLWRKLQEYGGVIFRNERVIKIEEEGGLVKSAITESGNIYEGKTFISNVHPAIALQWIDSGLIKPAYRKRISQAENSISAFMVNIVLQPGKVRYHNHNTYWNRNAEALDVANYTDIEWPANYALYFGEDPDHPGFADTVAILTYMHSGEFDSWGHTRNITANPSGREAAYHAHKERKAEDLIQVVAQRFPEIKEHMHRYKIATPLTFRDYMGTGDGSMYGIMADVNQQAQTQIPIRTKIPNFIFTGQNIGVHGVLGVSVNAVAACGELIGLDYLLQKINGY